ncbi:hypothetical protein BX661DRAFT_193994 [Kickxella alabastrina]|uniref:uncharacterized protein n=1 Tax=Kickxella alabastrina TaxID=61397 RepID=UPI00221F388C|nr:uncharacterized protein BX661DRAFT_193994 [Kickxella alabastrina]KAI7826754.1 hypothetical protein BX661DRAFT_193994 [Kickxella alabastrina]
MAPIKTSSSNATLAPSPPLKPLSMGPGPIGRRDFLVQDSRAYKQFISKGSDLEKYIFLSWLRNTNLNMFYRLVLRHLKEVAPIIYTPTVARRAKSTRISTRSLHRQHHDGLYISLNEVDSIDEIIANYKASMPEGCCPETTVITDGSRILGLGDLGINGMGIPVGKLQLYVAAAGLDPTRCLPIYLEDPLYLGIRQKRPADKEFYEATEKVLNGLTRAFPGIFIQFEDFNTPHAFGLLEQWRDRILCFNDDIQGTGSVILAGFISAIEHAGIPAKDQRILFFGAGSAGVGVAKQLVDYLVIEHHIPESEAKAMFWFVDSRGIITANRGDKLADHKVYFARTDNGDPTAMIGLSTIHKAFSEKILRRMNEMNTQARPIIFPLSNPKTKAECTFEEAMRCTDNRVLFASGTAFPEYTIPGTNDTRGNNMYVFPPIGLGAKLARPTSITDTMVFAVSKALSNTLSDDEIARGELYPRIERIRETSAQVAAAFIHQAVREGLAQDAYWIDLVKSNPAEGHLSDIPDGTYSQVVLEEVTKAMWAPADTVNSFISSTKL